MPRVGDDINSRGPHQEKKLVKPREARGLNLNKLASLEKTGAVGPRPSSRKPARTGRSSENAVTPGIANSFYA